MAKTLCRHLLSLVRMGACKLYLSHTSIITIDAFQTCLVRCEASLVPPKQSALSICILSRFIISYAMQMTIVCCAQAVLNTSLTFTYRNYTLSAVISQSKCASKPDSIEPRRCVTLEKVTSTKRCHKYKTFCAVCILHVYYMHRRRRDRSRALLQPHASAAKEDSTSLVRW